MDNKKDDAYYFLKIVQDIDAIKKHLNNETYEQFLKDDIVIDAIMFRLVQLIENIKNVSDQFKNNHSEIPWHKIIGFRNNLVHEYGKTDYLVVYQIVTNDLNTLKNLFEQYI